MSASSGARRNGAVFTPRPSAGIRSGLRPRLRAWLRRRALDRLLAAGEPGWASGELSRRAAQLTSSTERRAVAGQLDALLDEAMGSPRNRGAAVPVDRDGVLACRALLVELADDLRQAEVVRPQGVALLRRLLRDGGSPLYSPGETRALQGALIRARSALLLD